MDDSDDKNAAEMTEELDSESQDETIVTDSSIEENAVAEIPNEEDASPSSEEDAAAETKPKDDDSSPEPSDQDDQTASKEVSSEKSELQIEEDLESDQLDTEHTDSGEQSTQESSGEIAVKDDSNPDTLDQDDQTESVEEEASEESPMLESSSQDNQVTSSDEDPAEEVKLDTKKPTLSILSDETPESEPESEGQLGAADPVNEDGREWYVVHCYSGYENKVRHNLEQRIESMGMKNLIFDVVVPTEEEIEVKEGKRRTVERRVFPGYILINMILGEESWYVVRNTPGVTSFVGMGEEPTPLRPEEVSQIIKRMESDAPRIKVTFKQGERVRIVDGPFNDFRGTVNEIDMERAKVRVMVNFFGRETPVELDFLQVEKS